MPGALDRALRAMATALLELLAYLAKATQGERAPASARAAEAEPAGLVRTQGADFITPREGTAGRGSLSRSLARLPTMQAEAVGQSHSTTTAERRGTGLAVSAVAATRAKILVQTEPVAHRTREAAVEAVLITWELVVAAAADLGSLLSGISAAPRR